LCLIALFTSAVASVRPLLAAGRWRRLLSGAAVVLVSLAAAFAASLGARSMLAGAAVVLVAAVGWRYFCNPDAPRASVSTQWFWALLLTLLLFLGLAPFEYHGEVVRGLYYYLHTGVPGFNGIRKVSRQAVMLMLCFAVLSGFGMAIVLRWLARPWTRSAVFGVLLLALALEVRTAPFALAEVASNGTVPKAYRFIRKQRGPGGKLAPVAIAPAAAGKFLFDGPRGLALHNYLALYHGRRTLNGKSSWIPPVTQAVHLAMRYLPSDAAIRVLQLLGPQFLVVHTWDLRNAPETLIGLGLRKDLKQVYSADGDYVYEFLDTHDRSLGLLPTPTIDEVNNIPLRPKHIEVLANRNANAAYKAIDGKPKTQWHSGREQTPGDWLEFKLDRPRELVAIDFLNFVKNVFEAPAAFKIQSVDAGVYTTIFQRPRLRFYYDQVHRPTEFVMRVVFQKPVRTDRLRVRLLEGVPGQTWSAHEVRLWTPVIPSI
jgi:hypothetical protein